MRTRVAKTSLEAYGAFMLGGELPRQQRAVVDVLGNHPGGMTRAEIAQASGLRLSSVCGRVGELLERGAVEEAARRPCSVTGITAQTLRLARVQRELFAA